jgi:UDP-glucose 4-epimerase
MSALQELAYEYSFTHPISIMLFPFTQESRAAAGQYKQVDSVGTVNLIEAAKKTGVKKFVLLTSLLTNAKAIGQSDNSSYKFLNVSPSTRTE